MTTIAMAAGMFPSALGLGNGGGFRSPMAIAVIGGLIMSTMLSLVFVPAVFTVLDDLGRFTWHLFSRFRWENRTSRRRLRTPGRHPLRAGRVPHRKFPSRRSERPPIPVATTCLRCDADHGRCAAVSLKLTPLSGSGARAI